MDQKRIGIFISEERKRKNLTQQELADLLGVTEKTIGNWEHARSMPDISMLKLLCKELDVNLDELLDGKRKEIKNYMKENNNILMENPTLFGKRIMDRRLELNMSQEDLCNKILMSRIHLSRIERGLVLPNITTLLLICSALRISIDDLIYFKK